MDSALSARRLSRVMLPIGIIVTLLFAVGAGFAARDRARLRQYSLGTLRSARTPTDRVLLGSEVLRNSPDLGEAYAVRALGEAQLGLLDDARRDLACSDAGGQADQARTWIAFREGGVAAVLENERLGGPVPVDFSELVMAAGKRAGETRFDPTELDEWPRDLEALERELEGWVTSRRGTLTAIVARLALARIATLDLDDARAKEILEWKDPETPLDASLLEQERRLLAQIRREPTGAREPLLYERAPTVVEEKLDADLVNRTRTRAQFELERHRLTANEEDLEHATERLRRALVVQPDDAKLELQLLQALTRHAPANRAEIEALLPTHGDLDATVRFLLSIGEEEHARELAKGGIPESDRRDRRGSGIAFEVYQLGLEGWDGLTELAPDRRRSEHHRQLAMAARRAALRDRPWEARAELEELWEDAVPQKRGPGTTSPHALAEARVKDDPIGALELTTGGDGELILVLASVLTDHEDARAQLLARHVASLRADAAIERLAEARRELDRRGLGEFTRSRSLPRSPRK